MPRPQKATADYFQHYIKRGKTMFTLEAKYGNDGYALWFKTLELLTGTEHHYLDLSDDAIWEYYITFVNLNEEKTIEILNLLAKLNAIDCDLWKVKIVWSENLISNLSGLYNKRTVKPMDKYQIIAVSGAEIPNTGINDSDNPQRREEERKEENRRGEDTPPPPLSDLSFDEFTCKNSYELLHHVYQDIKKHNPKMPLVTGNMQPGDLSSLDVNLSSIYKLCNYRIDEFINVMQLKINDVYWAGELAKCNYPLARVISRFCKQVITDLQKKETAEKEKKAEIDKPVPIPMSREERILKEEQDEYERKHGINQAEEPEPQTAQEVQERMMRRYNVRQPI